MAVVNRWTGPKRKAVNPAQSRHKADGGGEPLDRTQKKGGAG